MFRYWHCAVGTNDIDPLLAMCCRIYPYCPLLALSRRTGVTCQSSIVTTLRCRSDLAVCPLLVTLVTVGFLCAY